MLVKEIAAHENKNRKYGQLLFPKQISELLMVYKAKLKADPSTTKDRNGDPIYLFESPQKKRKGQPRTNFDNLFITVRRALIEEKKELFPDDTSAIKHIEEFTQHRMRDLSDNLFKDCGASEAQGEVAAGRVASVGDTDKAYKDLTNEAIAQLKAEKFNLIVEREAEYLTVINTLIDKWKV